MRVARRARGFCFFFYPGRMSVRYRERRWPGPGTRGAGHAETIVRVHQGRDADAGLFAVRPEDSFASNRTRSVEMDAADFRDQLLRLETNV